MTTSFQWPFLPKAVAATAPTAPFPPATSVAGAALPLFFPAFIGMFGKNHLKVLLTSSRLWVFGFVENFGELCGMCTLEIHPMFQSAQITDHLHLQRLPNLRPSTAESGLTKVPGQFWCCPLCGAVQPKRGASADLRWTEDWRCKRWHQPYQVKYVHYPKKQPFQVWLNGKNYRKPCIFPWNVGWSCKLSLGSTWIVLVMYPNISHEIAPICLNVLFSEPTRWSTNFGLDSHKFGGRCPIPKLRQSLDP